MMKRYALPEGYNFFRSIYRTYKQILDPIGSMMESMRAYNGTYRVHLGTKQFIVTRDPDFIDHILRKNHRNYHKSEIQTDSLGRFIGYGLLTSNGDFWLRQRRLIQPGFHHERIHALYSNIERTATSFLKTFPEGAVDIYPLMNRLAFDIVMNALFNVAIPDANREKLGRFVAEAQDFVIRDIRQPHKRWWFRLSGEFKKNMDKSREARNVIREIILVRKNSNQKHGDLLDMLLDARYEDNGEPMSEEQLIDEILVLIIAGHETTANALSWTLYLLGTHREWLTKLRTATGALDIQSTVTNDVVNSVLSESMRLYPPAYVSDRVSLADDSYGAYSYPANTIVILFYYGLHRDPTHWMNPDSFDPGRFINGKWKERSKVFLPFGAGPRLCIGNSFAMAEMAIFLKSFVQTFEIAPEGHVPEVRALVTLRPDRVLMRISRRD